MFGKDNKPKRPTKQTVVHKTGWTGDSDTEGLFEENFLVAIIIGVAFLVFAIAGYYIGFDINLEWFAGQNFWSTAGIIILVIFIPAIAFSTFTGRSDLIAAEAIFILVGFVMIYLSHNFDFSSFIETFSSNWMNFGDFEFNVSTLMTVVLLIAIIVAVIGGIWRGSGISAAIIVVVCGVGIYVINSSDPSNIFREFGEMIGGATSGFLGVDVGAAAASGIVGSVIGLGVGILLAPVTGGISIPVCLGLGALAGGGGIAGSFAGWW